MSNTIKEAQDLRDKNTLINVAMNFNVNDEISESLIQRKCKVGYNSASRVLDKLIKDKKVKRTDRFSMGVLLYL